MSASRATLDVRIAGTGVALAPRCGVARTMIARMVGLLNHDALAEGEGLLIEPCNHVHSFFMRFPIDVVFLDRDDVVVAWQPLPAWRLSKMHWRARKVLELPLGRCQAVGLAVGQRLELRCSN